MYFYMESCKPDALDYLTTADLHDTLDGLSPSLLDQELVRHHIDSIET